MSEIIDKVSGKKTYIVSVVSIVYGLILIWQGDTERGVQVILAALGLGALRAGVTKSGPQ